MVTSNIKVTPQGWPLSLRLYNIMLDKVDKELEKVGAK